MRLSELHVSLMITFTRILGIFSGFCCYFSGFLEPWYVCPDKNGVKSIPDPESGQKVARNGEKKSGHKRSNSRILVPGFYTHYRGSYLIPFPARRSSRPVHSHPSRCCLFNRLLVRPFVKQQYCCSNNSARRQRLGISWEDVLNQKILRIG